MAARREADPPPAEFRRALASLRAAQVRDEIVLAEAPAPQRLAPHAAALVADVTVQDEDLATGRLVVLHDPERPEAWQGAFRVVTFVRAEVEAEMGADPLLAGVGWTWLTEALAARNAPYTAASGTVTRTVSQGFGAMADQPVRTELEVRASWTPLDADLAPHVEAWAELLCTAAGLPPLPPGVVAMAGRRALRAR